MLRYQITLTQEDRDLDQKRKTKQGWAAFIEEIAEMYKDAENITLVMDDLETHKPGSLYEAFWDKFEFIYTPKHGSWLNIAESNQMF